LPGFAQQAREQLELMSRQATYTADTHLSELKALAAGYGKSSDKEGRVEHLGTQAAASWRRIGEIDAIILLLNQRHFRSVASFLRKEAEKLFDKREDLQLHQFQRLGYEQDAHALLRLAQDLDQL
jgi:hypothetical protein